MNVKERLIQELVKLGMFESQATQVMEIATPSLQELVVGYSITMDSDSSEYPNVIYSILMKSVKPIALTWIEENIPEAWYKELFK